MLALFHEAESDLDGGHGVAVGIVLGILAELCVDGVLAGGNRVRTHVLSECSEVLVDLLDNGFWILSGEEEVKKFPTSS